MMVSIDSKKSIHDITESAVDGLFDKDTIDRISWRCSVTKMRVDGSWQGTKAAVVATHATKIATGLACISTGVFLFFSFGLVKEELN